MELTEKQGREITQRAMNGIQDALAENMDNFKATGNKADAFFVMSALAQEADSKGLPMEFSAISAGTPHSISQMFEKAMDESPELFTILKMAVAKQCLKSIIGDKK